MEERLITLASLPYSKAEILRSLLESSQVDCIFEQVNFLQNAFDTGVRIRILEKDARVAFPILEKMLGKISVDESKMENYVLVPVDFSTYSLEAALAGFDLAEKLESKMVMYHSSQAPEIIPIPYSDVIVYDSAMTLNLEMIEQATSRKFESFLNDLTARIDLQRWKQAKPEYIIKIGEAEDDIRSYVQIHPPRLIVMGLRGGGSNPGSFLGSTTSGVVFKTRVPVLAIPEKSARAWSGNIKKVVYATNFEATDFTAIDKLLKLMKPFGAQVICLHVNQASDGMLDEAMLEGMREALCDKYPFAGFDCRLIHHTNLYEAIDQFILANQIDIIALTTHRSNLLSRFFHPGLTREMVLSSKTPLLIFHI
jgi:nucleotide-binding universal stress UspA family protein